MKINKSRVEKHNRWGYIFLIPFAVTFIVFQLVPLTRSIYNGFFEYWREGLRTYGPEWNGIKNFVTIFKNPDMIRYFWNTIIMWIMGFVPQILVSLLLGAWFSNPRLRLKGSGFFKTVIYLPNVIMASALSMLFFALFSKYGPINQMLIGIGLMDSENPFDYFNSTIASRSIVAFMNFLMWFGNTTILLMAGMMGIDPELFEAAEVDGASSSKVFFRITLPLLRPILIYVIITSLIGGLQMFDVPQILTNGNGQPMRTTMTLLMYLNNFISKNFNYGMAGALSVFMFIVTGTLSLIVFKFSQRKEV